MPPPPPAFKPGDSVLLRTTRDMGRVEGEPERMAGEYWYTVRFNRRVDTVVEEDLEGLSVAGDSLEELAATGRWGRMQTFRSALAVERITNANQNTLYAFRAQRVLFEAFQYKPLLKLLESHDRRLLIADEVGLGKTIEAGLILAELEARQPLDRVLIVCPSRLREKWRDEMGRKFGQDFDIMARQEIQEFLGKLRRNQGRGRLRAVVSMQTLRNGDLRGQFLAELGSIGMVIVDEAHHARNPSSQTSQMLRDVCEVAEAVLLLTATPLHLGSRDLFTLLQALRPAEFVDPNVFDERLRLYKDVHEAALRVRGGELGEARDLLRPLFEEGVPPEKRDPVAANVIRDLGGPGPADTPGWVELERRTQDLHPLSSIITRTRKRDVQEFAATRRAPVLTFHLSDEEEAAYRRLVPRASRLDWVGSPMSIGEVQRARQAASCLPAALLAAGDRVALEDEPEVSDILPSELEGASAAELPATRGPLPMPVTDSKFAKLLEQLRNIDSKDTGAKVLIFTYFVGTSRYLERRLNAEGYPTLRIAGDVPSDPKRPERDERGRRMRRFQDDPSVRVMVSTEVGSEGLDFQFCHHLVNYDLPWNPMVVEHRIGRIDRFGQKHRVLTVLTLVAEGTVEERILAKLYERIGLFERSIGQLEAILGEQISKLQRDWAGGLLTPDEDTTRGEEMARAIERRRVDLSHLEQNVGHLFGHEEYLKEQLRRVGRLGRYVSERPMLAVIQGYLQGRHPSARLWEEEGIYNLRLTDDLRRDVQRVAPPDQPWVWRSGGNILQFCFDGQQAFDDPDIDLVNVSHPLMRAAVEAVREQLDNVHARGGRGVLPLGPAEDEGLPAGDYFVLVYCHVVESIRARRVLEPVAWSEQAGAVLASEDGERLLHLVLERGMEWDETTPSRPLRPATWAAIRAEAMRRSQSLRSSEKDENQALYARRRGQVEAEYAHIRKIKAARLETARERGRTKVLPLMEAQLTKAEARYHQQLADLERLREASCRLTEPLAACFVRVTRSDI